MIDLTKIFRVSILTTVVYLMVVLLSVFIVNTTASADNVDTFRTFDRYSDDFVTNCNLQPKKCPNPLSCDCTILCNDPLARRVIINSHDHPLNVRYGDHLPKGTYCYLPFGDECKEGFGVWIYKDGWHCMPLHPGRYETSGKTIQKHKEDEYGNDMKTVTFENGLSFQVRDYCLSNIRNSPATGYSDGRCICDNGTEHILPDNVTSPCVLSEQYAAPLYGDDRYAFNIECYDHSTYVKDLSKYLFRCPPNVPDGRNYVTSEKHVIK